MNTLPNNQGIVFKEGLDYLGKACVCQQCKHEWNARTHHRPMYCPKLADGECPRPWFWYRLPEFCPKPRRLGKRKRRKE